MEREWQKLLAADQLIAEIRKGNAFISFGRYKRYVDKHFILQ